MLLKRLPFIAIAALLWLTQFAGKREDAASETRLCAGRWRLHYEGLDKNGNGEFDKSEKEEVNAREKVYYEFGKEGKGVYSNNTTEGGGADIPLTWSLADSNRRLIVAMKGSTFSFRIYTLTDRKLILETKTTEGRGWEEYSKK